MILMDEDKLHKLYNTNYSNDATPFSIEPLLEIMRKLKEQQKNTKSITLKQAIYIEIREELL